MIFIGISRRRQSLRFFLLLTLARAGNRDPLMLGSARVRLCVLLGNEAASHRTTVNRARVGFCLAHGVCTSSKDAARGQPEVVTVLG